MTDLLAHFNTRLEDMVDTLTTLVEHESPTTDKAAVDRLGEWLAGELQAHGAQVERHPREPVGDVWVARWNAGAPGKPLLFLCHIDTVWDVGTLEKQPLRHTDEGQLYGPGTYDMKGGITAALFAIRELRALGQMPDRPVHMLLTTDEETGSHESRDIIAEMAGESALVMVTEPALPDGSLKTARKGTGLFQLHTYGVAAHAGGAHPEGVNAIAEMAHQVLRVQEWTDYERGTTTSAGIVEGGTRSNVVPDECRVDIDVRVISRDEERRVTQLFDALEPVLPGARVEVSGGFDRPPMERDALMIETFRRAQAIAADLGLTLDEGESGGGSDGNLTAALGVPTLDGLGPMGAGAHAVHEHIVVSDLAARAALMAGLVRDWPA